MSASAGDATRVTVFVRVPPERAFEIFTRETDAWWKHGPKFRVAGRRRGRIAFEPELGGRLFETFETADGARTVVVGTIHVWDRPRRFEFEWRGVNFAPGQSTWVEVSFEPSGGGTLVSVCHRGWSRLPDDHPARHGRVGAAFSRNLGFWWGELLTALRESSEKT